MKRSVPIEPLFSPLVQVHLPAIQSLPEQRARIDPSITADIASFLLVLKYRHYLKSIQTLRGLKGHARRTKHGMIKYARLMVRVYDEILVEIHRTVDARQLDAARRGMGLDPIP